MGNAIFKSSPSGRSIVRGSFYRCVVVKCGPEGLFKLVAVVFIEVRDRRQSSESTASPMLTSTTTLTQARRQFLLREPLHLLHEGAHLSFLLGAVVLFELGADFVAEVAVDGPVAGHHRAHGFS